MADLSNSSSTFIPKRGPAKRVKNSSTRQVYFFTLVSYTLMFATLLGAGGVYFYSKYIDKQLATEVSEFNKEIKGFNEANMQRVQDYDLRLQQASSLVANNASVQSIFSALEEATIDTVQIKSLKLLREFDDRFLLSATVETDSFDSTIFQRSVYKRDATKVTSVSIEGVHASGLESNSTSGLDKEGTDEGSVVTFKAELEIPVSAVPFVASPVDYQPLTITQPAVTPQDTALPNDEDIVEINQSDI